MTEEPMRASPIYAAFLLTIVLAFGAQVGCDRDNTSQAGDGGDDLSGSTDGGVGGMCAGNGVACANAAACCTLDCTNGACAATQCVSDNQPCTAGGAACCSTQCVNGSCKPLNTTCKTAGNSCAGGGDCCSKLCVGGTCAVPSQVSYCTQLGDICFADGECCTGVCLGASGATAGTCAAIATSCSVDGTSCNGCSTTPRCCSGFCAPFGASGATICQPASGCHVLGDLCHATTDCCGGDVASGLPGAGLVICVPDPTHPQIGTCSMANPNNCPNNQPTCKNTCQPEGDVCHFKGVGGCSSNSFPANCCGAPGSASGMCQLDKLGVPRCYGLAACVMAGGSCASSADCCNGVPCTPNASGALTCGTAMCVDAGGVCTTTADCCTGLACNLPPGALKGTCTAPTAPPSDGGAPPVCALYGQACSTTTSCCGGQGTCLGPYPTSAACAAGEADCTCYTPLM